MKLEQNPIAVTSTISGEVVRMGIAPEDMAHIMGVLSGLYKNRMLAFIREYSTNAADAHVEAGVSLPICVATPTALCPEFVVRDFGLGLDAEDIRRVYSQYGNSTKRDSNAVVGMLGLGSKSALTYGDQFTVTSVKNGRRITVLVARATDGAGSMTILGDVETDETSGTEIRIAVRSIDHRKCQEEAEQFFAFWPAGSVLLNGVEPPRFDADENVLKINDRLYLLPFGRFRAYEDIVVMGNVAYPADLHSGTNHRVIAFVEIGAVRPTPSREGLMDVPATQEMLTILGLEVKEKAVLAAQAAIDACTTGPEALKCRNRWNMVSTAVRDMKWRGKDLPLAHPSGPQGYPSETLFVGQPREVSRGNFTRGRDWPSARWPGTFWVTGFTGGAATAQHKRKVLHYLGDKVDKYDTIVLCSTPPPAEFIDAADVVPFSTIKAIKLPTTASASSRSIAGSYEGLTEMSTTYCGGLLIDVADLRDDVPLIYVENYTSLQRVREVVKQVVDAYTIVKVAGNRMSKFQRCFPEALSYEDFLAGHAEQAFAALDKEDVKAYYAKRESNAYTQLAVFDAAQVDDPALKTAIKLCQRDTSAVSSAARLYRDCAHKVTLAIEGTASVTDVLDNYPLLSTHYLQDSYVYVNGKYAATK